MIGYILISLGLESVLLDWKKYSNPDHFHNQQTVLGRATWTVACTETTLRDQGTDAEDLLELDNLAMITTLIRQIRNGSTSGSVQNQEETFCMPPDIRHQLPWRL